MTSPADDIPAAVVHVADEGGLGRLAAIVAERLPPAAFVALTGDLGAGKTTFVKAVAAALGLDPTEVVSPTFGLIHVHHGIGGRLVHADLYRLATADELHETGWEDAIAATPGAWCRVFVEWPGRIAGLLPADRLDVAIAIDSETGRTLSFASRSAGYRPLIEALRHRPRA